MGHGWEGVVLKLMRGRDFTFTVTATEPPADGFRRVAVTDGGLLAATGGAHPTMWVRLWFDRSGKPHQRAYTLVDPDPEAGTFTLEFALHEGPTTDWALAAKPGDTIDATLQGTGFSLPDPTPSRLVVIGDPASLPAMNSLLDALPDTRRPSGTRPSPARPANRRCGWTRPATRSTGSSGTAGARRWSTR